MKKLLIALTAVAVVSAAQAASVGWSLAGANNFANDAYMFFVIGQNGVSGTDTITGLLDSGDVAGAAAKAFGSGTVASNGAANVTAGNSGKTLDAGTYTAFYVIFDANPATSATKYALVTSANMTNKEIKSTVASFTFAAQNQSSVLNNANNWKAVPEPTTVALLALGLAAVGLKRKVA